MVLFLTKLNFLSFADISADVIACTCVGAGDPSLAGRKFSVCVIDEATQV